MFATPEQIAAANKANLEALVGVANAVFANAEKLAALNLDTARALLEDGLSGTRSLIDAKDVQEVLELQSSLGKPLVEATVSYNRSLYELATNSQEQFTRLVDSRVSEMNKSFSGLIDQAARSAPAGSDVAFAAIKSALAAANSAYDNANKVGKQVSELAEASVSAASDATVKAMGAAAKPAPARKSSAS